VGGENETGGGDRSGLGEGQLSLDHELTDPLEGQEGGVALIQVAHFRP
jgi:hypothetical protein